MLTDLLWNLTIIAINGHTSLILRTDIRNSYVRIHPHRMAVSSLFTEDLYIRHFMFCKLFNL